MEEESFGKLFDFEMNDVDLFVRAFTHKSKSRRDSYEKLELLGDAVLSLVILKYLIDTNPKLNEGELTKLKTRLVCGKTLATIARNMGFAEHVRMSNAGMENGFNENDKVLEDTFEATVGAIYRDQGLPTARRFIIDAFTNPQYLDWKKATRDDNWKDQLMRARQAEHLSLPTYERLQCDEARVFRVAAVLDGDRWGVGKGKTLREAEQQSAFFALRRMEISSGKRIMADAVPRPHL